MPFSLAQAQPTSSNLREKVVEVKDTIWIDTLSIVPQSFSIEGIPADHYVIDEINAYLTWNKKPLVSSIRLRYRVLFLKWNAPVQKYNYDSIRFNFIAGKAQTIKANPNQTHPMFDFGKLESNGSFGRAISFGNNQDAIVQSSMNLQLQGYIGDSLELTAAITDNNLPIQPEGNTQDLRDFDRIYLQIRKNKWQASFGDIDVRESKSYFLNFYKRLQGASFLTENKIGKKAVNTAFVSGAIAKGKFNRHQLIPVEGNQGPYKLQGANNEMYFVVLAGTERVFIDGELLQRGEDDDYVINYNTAEITFTANRLITKDKRIQIEFEYADRNYLNSQIFAVNETRFSKKFKVNLAFYNNMDAKNSTIDQSLDLNQKHFLSTIGDSIQNAFYQNAVKDTMAPGKILYKKVEVVYNGTQRDSIFVLSSDPNEILYQLSFTYMGPGKGNYRQLIGTINGQAFEWVMPNENNEMMGEWEPVTLLVTPKQLQVVTLGFQYDFNSKNKLQTEFALSKYDVNLFSSKDKNNDIGTGVKLRFESSDHNIRLANKNYKWQVGAGLEYVADKFQPLERLRNVEFYRDWSLPYDALPATEHLVNISLGVTHQDQTFKYDITNYHRDDGYNGFRHVGNWRQNLHGWNTNAQVMFTHFNSDIHDGNFIRPTLILQKQFPKLKQVLLGLKYVGEFNRVHHKALDSLDAGSFGFHMYDLSLNTNPEMPNKYGFQYTYREDWLPYQNKLYKTDRSNNYTLTSTIMRRETDVLKMNLTYRDLAVLTTVRPSLLQPEKSLLGRLDYLTERWNGFVIANFLYEIGTGQEQRREFSYVEVPAGQGEYAWFDYNNNGIPDLNEFEIAIFQDQKKYVRVYTPSNVYVKANYLQFNSSLQIEPSVLIADEAKGFKNILKKTSATSALQISKKKIAGDDFLFNPFVKELMDTSLVSFYSFLSNTLFFNRSNPTWGWELSQMSSNNKALLAYGFESRKLNQWNVKTRYAFSKRLQTVLVVRNSQHDLTTTGSNFINRNYQIDQWLFEPTLTYMYKNKFRSILSYSYQTKENRIDSMEQSIHHILTLDMRYHAMTNSALSVKFSYNQIDFKAYPGAANSTVGFIMLDGLLPGGNYLWNVELTKRIAGNLELSLQYDGRKPGNTRAIHTGRASIRALF